MGKRYIELERNQGSVIQSKYSCAFCWNPVRVRHDKEGDYITCETEDCRCDALLTTRYIDKLVEESEGRARRAREVLQVSCEWLRVEKKPRNSIEESLRLLGFSGE